jgi:hypothetical protein
VNVSATSGRGQVCRRRRVGHPPGRPTCSPCATPPPASPPCGWRSTATSSSPLQLADGETRTVDIGAHLHPGSDNTVVLTATGKPGGSAVAIIHN